MGKGWKNPIKVANAQKKGAVFTKLAREIQVAAKLGGPDPNANTRLRAAMDAARKAQCPTDTIDRAIKKGSGQLDDGAIIEEVMFEGFGPHGVGVLVECQTDNRNRTVPEIRMAFKSGGGHMGESGSVAWMFERVGLVEASKPGKFDPEEEAIEAGAEEVEKSHDETQGAYDFYTHIETLESVRDALQKRGWHVIKSELYYKAKNKTELTESQLKEVHEFLNELDDHDDTSKVFATIG